MKKKPYLVSLSMSAFKSRMLDGDLFWTWLFNNGCQIKSATSFAEWNLSALGLLEGEGILELVWYALSDWGRKWEP